MFLHFFLREVVGGLKRPMVWIFFFVFGLLAFGAVSSDSIVIGGSVGTVYKNAPHIIYSYVLILGLFALLVATAFFNNAALRDHKNNFQEILYSTPLSKAGFFFGRFGGATILSSIPLLGIFVGVWLSSIISPAVGWVEPDRIGPMYFETLWKCYFIFILPNMFFAGTVIYALANASKSTVVSFVGALGLIVAYTVAADFLSDLDNQTLGALTDSFATGTYRNYTQYFTPVEKNTISPGLSGVILWNRLIWVSVGLIVLILGYARFSFRIGTKKPRKQRASSASKIQIATSLPAVELSHSGQAGWAQFKSFAASNTRTIVNSTVFRILFLFCAILLIANMVAGFEYYGLKSYPVTYKVAGTISGLSGLFIMITLVFFSGELIWRDRGSKINEVIDATPHGSLISLAAKMVALVAATTLLYGAFVVVGILFQLANGYTNIELSIYLGNFLFGALPSYITWGAIFLFLHVIINHKYLGYFVCILLMFALGMILSVFDVQSNMLAIGEAPSIQYSDMNGFGPGLTGAMWFNLYWMLFGALALMAAGLLWLRGQSSGFKTRFSSGRKHLTPSYTIALVVVGAAWLLTSGFVYYNTQSLNTYNNNDQQEEILVSYEKTYGKYRDVVRPKVTDISYNINIFPEERDVTVLAQLTIENKSHQAIDSIHYNLDPSWEVDIRIPGATQVLNDTVLDYQIFALAASMQPGATMDIEIETAYRTTGFENGRGNTNIVSNGTFFNNRAMLPAMGYQENLEISGKNDRKKHGLPPKARMAKLTLPCGHECNNNYLSDGASDWVNVETIISTSGSQRAIAPGSLVKEWQENGRNFFHYKVDHASLDFYSFMSAEYEVASRKWQGVDIEVYYHKTHEVNVPMMLDAVQRSLEYYTANFGPYHHKQARIIEFPRYSTFAQAFPGTMPYSESFGFITNLEDADKNNVIDAVIAHEMAHQWWAHQEISANVQGATMLTESFAEYSSLMVMKTVTDPVKMREFIKYDHDRYLGGRSRETEKELPLYLVENQQYIHYGKGSVILYALQDYIGEYKVNSAMRTFLEEFAYAEPPYANTNDFLRHLEPVVPDSLSYLIDDWFKEITLYDLRVTEASSKALADGQYEVTMQIHAQKLKADTIGNETPVPINDWIDIGVFADGDEKDLILEQRVKITAEQSAFTLTVDREPYKAAIDPRRLLIERVSKDNVKRVLQAD